MQLVTGCFEHGQIRFLKGSFLLEVKKLHLMTMKSADHDFVELVGHSRDSLVTFPPIYRKATRG